MSLSTLLRRLVSLRVKRRGKGGARHTRPILEALEDRTLTAVMTVNTAADVFFPNQVLSLREAIGLANGQISLFDLSAPERAQVSGEPKFDQLDTIIFNIGGGGPATIVCQFDLPTILDRVIIDGTGAAGTPNIALDGHAGPIGAGLVITGGGSTVRGLVIHSFLTGDGIVLSGGGGNVIEGNYIGTDFTGKVDQGNKFDGIVILNSPGNTIGGTTPAARNVISGNDDDGITVVGSASTGNKILGNFIGTDVDGKKPLGNTKDGIDMFSAPGNTIGGASALARNVISANGNEGVSMGGSLAVGNKVLGNYIGTDVTGMIDLGNTGNGVLISEPTNPDNGTGGANNNTIGGEEVGAGNLISGNNESGVQMAFGAFRNLVQGNYIGVKANGVEPLGNTLDGVAIFESPSNTVGGLTSVPGLVPGNVISGNGGHGVFIGIGKDEIITAMPNFNEVLGNYIGLDDTGTAAIGNTKAGVLIKGGSFNTIGAALPDARNVISGNDGGVEIVGKTSTFNFVLGNYIGLNVSGTAAVSTKGDGVKIDGASDNTIGGLSAGERNVISGNQNGILITGSDAKRNHIRGNYIGTNPLGAAGLGNREDGVVVQGARDNFIGGTAAGAGNLISANLKNGVVVTGHGASNNPIHGNRIGTDHTGVNDLGNKRYGVSVRDFAHDNQIGGADDGAGNIIAFNGSALGARGHGVVVESAAGIAIRRNSIFSNTGRGIDLVNPTEPDTFTLNDAGGDKDVGANELQDYPVVVAVQESFLGKFITWELDSTPNRTFTIDLFANSKANLSGFGDGERYLTSMTVDTNATGIVRFVTVVGTADKFISVTATLSPFLPTEKNSTSEFSMVDTDADALADAWETRGIDLDEDGQVDFSLENPSDPFLRADPEAKDIFVEVDAMAGLAPTENELFDVVLAFLKAPLANPDGTTGIVLHAWLDETMPRELWAGNFDGDGSDALGSDRNADGIADPSEVIVGGALVPGDPDDQEGWQYFHRAKKNGIGGKGGFGTSAERANPVALAAKRLVYRYAIFADQFAVARPVDLTATPRLVGGTSLGTSGKGEIIGNDFMVTLGHPDWEKTPEQRSGTFMHELGHVLGLEHGGGDAINNKPNYHSIMNYTWQTPNYWWMFEDIDGDGIRDFYDLDGDGTQGPAEPFVDHDYNGDGNLGDKTWTLDYSARAFDTLDENNLDESKGIGGHLGHWVQAGIGVGSPQRVGVVPEFGPVDWSGGDKNNDGTSNNDTGVQANVNFGAGNPLVGYDDWSNLRFYFYESSFFAEGASAETHVEEMTVEIFEERNALGPGPGILDFRLNTYDANEDAGAVTVAVTRAGGTQGTVTVDFATVDGSATAGSDYQAASGTLTFADGEYVKTFTVLVHNDAPFELPEAFGVTLSNPRGGAVLGRRSSMTLRILDEDPANFDVTNTNDSGPGSLRQAILAANLYPGADVITFHNPAGGLLSIRPLSALPTITDTVTIDGFSQPGFVGTPLVELDGSLAGPGASGLTVAAQSSTIRGLAINRFAGAGIRIEPFFSENRIHGNFIGTDATGTIPLGNGGFGVEIDNSFVNVIGSTEPGGRNVISGNAAGAVFIHGGLAFGNSVIGNRIGTQLDGVSPLGNGGPGVLLDEDVLLNIIGSADSGGGNTIAFNAGTGLLIRSGQQNLIQMNSIFANGGLGIDLGGDGVTANDALFDQDGGPNDLVNYPELTFVASFDGHTNVKGTLKSTRNASFTLEFYASAAADASGFGEGQLFLGAATVVTNAAGQAIFDVSLPHQIEPGSFVTATARWDLFSSTSEFSAAFQVPLPALVNPPVLTEVASYGGRTDVTGSLTDTPSSPFTIEFYTSAAADGFGLGAGQFLGATNMVTDAAGLIVFDAAFPHPTAPGSFLAAVARDRFGTRSQFSAPRQVPVPTTMFFTVNTIDDVDDGVADDTHTSLREAILAANRHVGPDVISFDIPGLNRAIAPLSPLPEITDPVTIDATTQPGFKGLPLVELEGSAAGIGADGLRITGGGSVVRGLVINRFRADPALGIGGHGVMLFGFGGNRVEGNFLGTDVTGTSALPNQAADVFIKNSKDNVLGGTTAAARNLILTIWMDGFEMSGPVDTSGNRVQGNFIGVDVTGTARLESTSFFTGIRISSSDANLVGGMEAGAGNLIVGEVDLLGANDNIVQGNLIGTDVTGTVDLSGSVAISSGRNNLIGGTTAAARNIITGGHNRIFGNQVSIAGVVIFANDNLVQGNYIGTDITGTLALTGKSFLVSQVGAGVFAAGTCNVIGGTAPGAGNVISGFEAGVLFSNGSRDNFLLGNRIGTDVTGTQPLGNLIGVRSAGSRNIIGGIAPGAGNLISGNSALGLSIGNEIVQGNFIGTDRTGTLPVGNGRIQTFSGWSGGVLSGGDAIIGGAEPGAGNLISGNAGHGITLTGAGAVVQGNLIGTDATGTLRLGNLGDGIQMSLSPNNLIGGTAPGEGNVISANGRHGVSGHLSTGSRVQGNRIGTDATGTRDLGNTGDGVSIMTSSHVVGNNVIGGANAGAGMSAAGNVIAYNGGHGVSALFGAGNSVRGNAIFANGSLGIASDINGVLSSYAEERGLELLSGIPVLGSAIVDSQGVLVAGALTGVPFTTYDLDFFANDTFDPSGFGEGQRVLESIAVVTDATGAASFQVRLESAVPAGQWLTATATDPAGTTSQFSRGALVLADALPAHAVQLTAPVYVVTENGAAAVVVVTRTGAGVATVDYATLDGSALAGADYTGIVGTLTFGDGDTSKTLTIPVHRDGLAEGEQSFRILLTNPSGASLGSQSEAVVTIVDPDTAGQLEFSSSVFTVTETSQATIQVKRTGGARGRVAVDYRVTGGTATPSVSGGAPDADFADFFGTLIFEDGQTTAEATLSGVDETVLVVFEGPETIELTLGNPTGGATLGSVTSAVVTVRDDEDAQPVAQGIRPPTDHGLSEAAGVATYQLIRRDIENGILPRATVNFSTHDGTAQAGVDYEAAAGTLVFELGEERAFLSIRILEDSLVEDPETFQVILSNPDGVTLEHDRWEVTIEDNENHSVTPGQFVLVTGRSNENAGIGGFTVERRGGSKGEATVTYATSDGTATAGADYTAASGTLTFADGETTKSVLIPILPDFQIEGEETFLVTLSNPIGGATISGNNPKAVTIYETGGLFQFSAADYRVAESNAEFTVTITFATGLPVGPHFPFTLAYQIHDGTAHAGADYTPVSGTLTFPPFSSRQTITIPILNDALVEDDETILLTLTGANDGASVGATVTLTILDEDFVGSSASQVSAGGPYSIREGDALPLLASISSGNPCGCSSPDLSTADFSWDVNGDGVYGDAVGQNPTLTWLQLQALGIVDGPSTFGVRVRAKTANGEETFSEPRSLTVGNVAPTLLLGGTAATDEGAPYTLGLSANDAGQDTISNWRIDWGDGTIDTLLGDRSAALHTYADGPKAYTIVATATDEDGSWNAEPIVVAVHNVAPTAVNDSAVTNEDHSIAIAILANDSDPAGALDPLQIVTVTNGVKGATSIDNKGTLQTTDDEIVYTPNASATGSDSFTYTISDGDGGTATATVSVQIRNLVDFSGRVFDDKDNDGAYGPGDGDVGIAGVTVQLLDETSGALIATQLTALDGSYFFDVSLGTGTYKVVAAQSAGFLDGRETAGNLGGAVDNTQDSNQITGINIGAPGTTSDAIDYLFARILPSQALGLVWLDADNDGEVDSGESVITGVAVELTGLDDRGQTVSRTATTDASGVYAFLDLRPSSAAGYTIRELQPPDYADGLDILGTVNGVAVGTNSANDIFTGVVLPSPNSQAEDYNFGERPVAASPVQHGQTATIGFWQNKNGQKLIKSLNGGPTAKQLGNWLAATFPNMYGAFAGANNLAGKTNADVAAFYKKLFARTKCNAAGGGPPKMDAQVLATALAVYVTNGSLAGTIAAPYGFLVTANGVGSHTFNIGCNGAAIGVANNSQVTVLNLLLAVNVRAHRGRLYDLDADGDANDSRETSYRTKANIVFSAINEAGDI